MSGAATDEAFQAMIPAYLGALVQHPVYESPFALSAFGLALMLGPPLATKLHEQICSSEDKYTGMTWCGFGVRGCSTSLMTLGTC